MAAPVPPNKLNTFDDGVSGLLSATGSSFLVSSADILKNRLIFVGIAGEDRVVFASDGESQTKKNYASMFPIQTRPLGN